MTTQPATRRRRATTAQARARGTASTWNYTSYFGNEYDVWSGDFNGDALADLYECDTSGNYNVMLGVPPTSPLQSALEPASLWCTGAALFIGGIGDVDGGGASDIIAPNNNTSTNVTLAQPETRTSRSGVLYLACRRMSSRVQCSARFAKERR